MGNVETVPGQMNQPAKDIQGPGWDTFGWVATESPKVDYAEKNPLQETTPMQIKSWDNASHTISPTTTQEINGGRDIMDGGGVG